MTSARKASLSADGISGQIVLGFNAACLATCRESTRAYDLGIWQAAAAFVLSLALLDLELTRAVHAVETGSLSVALETVSLLSALGLAFSSISIPRRPQVYKNGRPVERQLTVSAIERVTYTWAHDLLRLASAKQDLEITDFPTLDHDARSADRSAAWKQLPAQPRLWMAVFRAYRGRILQQWALALVKGVINYAPHFFLLKLLETIERGLVSGHWPLEAWAQVFAIALSMIVDGVSGSGRRCLMHQAR